MGLEREYKFLLNKVQYISLWKHLRDESTPLLQENTFFDRDEVLRNLKWVLRLRIEAEHENLDNVDIPLGKYLIHPLRSIITLKGPRIDGDGAVVRPEEEEMIEPALLGDIGKPGCIPIELIPSRLRSILASCAGQNKLPSAFDAFASFRNLRLEKKIGGDSGFIAVALDRAESIDGRVRYELEIETAPENDNTAAAIMRDLRTSEYKLTNSGKFAWIMQIDK